MASTNHKEIVNVVLVGVGGQGSVLAGQILARAAMLAGYSAAASEVHGMAQRGGSVVSTVRFGPDVLSPAVPEGEADFLLAFEKLEALRYASVLKPGGVAIVNDQRITPTIESLKLAPYPDDTDVEAALSERAGRVLLVPGLEIALKLGDARLANTVLLGVLSTFWTSPKRRGGRRSPISSPRKPLSSINERLQKASAGLRSMRSQKGQLK